MNGPSAWAGRVTAALQRRADAGCRRLRPESQPINATHLEMAGRRLVNFASNDYLGLSAHPRVTAAFVSASRPTVGSGAAPLVAGRTVEHALAETALARWKGSASAVLLGSGYAANAAAIGTVAAVAGGVHFLVDKLAHASLIDAVRGAESSGATFRTFAHNDLGRLARLLVDAGPDRAVAVVTESIFSMDGDAADLLALVEMRDRYGFLLVVDEAHAAGVYGPAGAGLAAEVGVAADLSIVTLSKAVGVIGGAVCASADWVEAVVNFGRPYVFSTSPPAAVAAAVTASLAVMADEPHRQARVRWLASRARSHLSAAGVRLPPGDSPILPVVLGTETAAVAAAERLAEAGLFVAAIRPPTVVRGTSRLRATLSCEHTDAEVERLLAALVAVAQSL